MLIEKLESRRHFDIAMTGGPGHAGVAVDVHGDDGIKGLLKVDFYATGWEPGAQGSGGGNPITGSQGVLYYVWEPGKNCGDLKSGIVVHTTPEQDAAALARINQLGGPSSAIANTPKTEQTVDAQGDYATYYVDTRNCFGFVGAILNACLRNPDKRPPTPYGDENSPASQAHPLLGDWDGMVRKLGHWLQQPADGQWHSNIGFRFTRITTATYNGQVHAMVVADPDRLTSSGSDDKLESGTLPR